MQTPKRCSEASLTTFQCYQKKKLTWSPPISHFIHFLVNQLQDQPLFQEKKIDRGTPIEGFQEYFKATPPQKKREKVVKTPQF